MKLDCEVVITRSGARAIRDRITGEIMHPVVGPAMESERLYTGPARIRERLAASDSAPLTVFDVGLGGGANAIAARRLSELAPPGFRRMMLVSFDQSFDALALATRAENAEAFAMIDHSDAIEDLLTKHQHESPRTTWRARLGNLPQTLDNEPPGSADVVFWDPFSPKSNPELWTFKAFAALRARCAPGATLHTYSGATSVRSALLLAGFAVGLGPQVSLGKTSTIAAIDPALLDQPLDARWLERLARSSAPFPHDAPNDALKKIAALPQFRTGPE